MKKLLTMAGVALMLAMAMATTAMAAEYNIDGPEDPLFASPTSVDQVTVVGGGVTEQSNIDRSKNAAVVPPPFGSPESYQTGSGAVLIPQTQTQTSGSATTPIGGGTAYYPPAESVTPPASDFNASNSSTPFTLPDDLYYSDGSIGRLKIPSIGVNVKVYETESLAKGAGHFKSTSCWDGNVGIAGHNRGVTNHFGKIHTLKAGDQITYTTQLGTRTYEVFFVGQIEETDFSRLERTNDNLITLVTCVRDVRNMRWCVQAREVR
jgi:sortase A